MENTGKQDLPTTREYEVTDGGRQRLKRVVYTRTRFQLLDLILKVIGTLGIGLAALSLWNQYRQVDFQIKQQKLLFQLKVYEDALSVMQTLSALPPNDTAYKKAKTDFAGQIYPRMSLTNNPAVIHATDSFNYALQLKEYFSSYGDSLARYTGAVFGLYNHFNSALKDRAFEDSGNIEKVNRYVNYFFLKERSWTIAYEPAMNALFKDSVAISFANVDRINKRLRKFDRRLYDILVYVRDRSTPYDWSATHQMTKAEFLDTLKRENLDKVFWPVDSVVVDSRKKFRRIEAAVNQIVEEKRVRIVDTMIKTNILLSDQ